MQIELHAKQIGKDSLNQKVTGGVKKATLQLYIVLCPLRFHGVHGNRNRN